MKKVIILFTILFTLMMCVSGCDSSIFDGARVDYKSLYLEITNDIVALGREESIETLDMSKAFNEAECVKKILGLKDIVTTMEENANSERQERILTDYRDFYEALVEIQSYTAPDSECSEEELILRNKNKLLVSMGWREAKGNGIVVVDKAGFGCYS